MIAVVVALWLGFQVTPEMREHIEAGLKAKAAGDIETTIREFKLVTELAPDLAAAHVNLGAVYIEKRDYANAIPPLERAIQLDADLPGAEAMLGAALLARGYAAEAIPHLEKGQADDLLGVALIDAGRVRDAVDRLEAAILKRPNDPDLLYYLALAHGQISRQLLEQLKSDYPASPRTQQILGDALTAAGNRDAAEQRYRAALAVRSDLHGVHFAIGELALDVGDYEKAEREFRAEAQLVPGSAAAAYKLGLALLNRGQVSEAVAELQRSNSLQPDMPETLLELGKALSAADDSAGAERPLRRLLELEQASKLAETAHFQLAQIYRKLGRTADADREMRSFQQLRRDRK